MKNKHRFEFGGYGVVIESPSPITRYNALKYLAKNLRNTKVKRNFVKNN